MLQARVTVIANGNQRFVVPVALAVRGVSPLPVTHVTVTTSPTVAEGVPLVVPEVHRVADRATPAPALRPLAAASGPPPAGLPPLPSRSASSPRLRPIHPVPTPAPEPVRRRSLWPFLFVLSLVVIGLLVAVGFKEGYLDPGMFQRLLQRLRRPAPAAPRSGTPLLTLTFDDAAKGMPAMTFGLVLAEDRADTGKKLRRLTFDERGRTNNVCYLLDTQSFLLGQEHGTWTPGAKQDSAAGRNHSVWKHEDTDLYITQEVEIIRGPVTRLLDTCLVRYRIENRDTKDHSVGLRFLLDTFIGSRDGVPFLIPGKETLCDTIYEQRLRSAVPDFLEAAENDDLAKPGTVAHLCLRPGTRMEAPERVVLGAWPDEKHKEAAADARGARTRWEVPPLSMKTADDSAVTMYWPVKTLGAGKRREVGFTYGLGTLAGDTGQGRLAVSVGGSFAPRGTFSVVAQVKRPAAGEKLSLDLPTGFTLPAEVHPTQAVPSVPDEASRGISVVTWKVRAPEKAGTDFSLKVRSSAGPAQTRTVVIEPNSELN
jgi:hypothetical protein